MTAPLLQCEDARIDVDQVPLIDGLSCQTEGQRVGLAGGWDPLFSLLARQAELHSGSALVDGHPAATAVPDGVVGLALREPAAPDGWTACQYLEQSALLDGMARAAARAEARRVLEDTGLGALGRRPLGALAPVERRAVLLVHAALGSPAVIALQAPLSGLSDAWAEHLGQIIERMAPSARWLVSVSDPAPGTPERAMLDRLDEVLLLQPGGVVSRGGAADVLAPGLRYLVVVTRQARALVEQLRQRGLRVDVAGAGQVLETEAPRSEQPGSDAAHLVVHLSDQAGTGPIVEAALSADAPIVELVPLGG